MDLNEKVEQLAQITASLKNDINELKGKDLDSKVYDLEQETAELKNDINDLRYCLLQQNEKILALLNERNKKLEETIDTEKSAPHMLFSKNVSEYSKRFPIASLAELDAVDELINDFNQQELIAIFQLLTPLGIVKNINNIISTEVIMHCNVDGHHNRRRLLNHTKFMDLLYEAAYSDGYSQKAFLDDVRRGLKMVKNRYNKHRQLLKQGQEHNPDQLQATELFETEEIFFDD